MGRRLPLWLAPAIFLLASLALPCGSVFLRAQQTLRFVALCPTPRFSVKRDPWTVWFRAPP